MQTFVLEVAVKEGGFRIGGDQCPEGVSSPHSGPIKENENCFRQEDHSQETVEETPKGSFEVEGSIRPLYSYHLSKDLAGRNGRIYVEFIIPLCY